jgi:hypothetical protein
MTDKREKNFIKGHKLAHHEMGKYNFGGSPANYQIAKLEIVSDGTKIPKNICAKGFPYNLCLIGNAFMTSCTG